MPTLLACFLCQLLLFTPFLTAQIFSGGGRPFVTAVIPVVGPSGAVIGGISIDPDGVVTRTEIDSTGRLSQFGSTAASAPAVGPISPSARKQSQLRKVSLKKLEQEVTRLRDAGLPLSSEVLYLAGLQRIEFVLVDQEAGDIILAGPAEGWHADEEGFVVGDTTGLPVVDLCDLITALRTTPDQSIQGVTCSMDATPDGLQRYYEFLNSGNVEPNEQSLEQMRLAIGNFEVTFSGIQPHSHFARTLIASDLMLKRLGMHLEESPVRGVNSYLELMQRSNRRNASNVSPRWWLASDYQPVLRDEDGLAWQIRGQGVRAMTAGDVLNSEGEKVETIQANPIAERWAEDFSEHYTQLSVELPVLGKLRNCMDLTVVAALINRYQLFEKAGFESTVLRHNDQIELAQYDVPRFTEPQVSYARGRGGWIVTVSGGVDIDGWSVAANTEVDARMADGLRQVLNSQGAHWWWD
ncbi:MAG: DUF1598 domain-containing protein [Planctomycetota bacterium]